MNQLQKIIIMCVVLGTGICIGLLWPQFTTQPTEPATGDLPVSDADTDQPGAGVTPSPTPVEPVPPVEPTPTPEPIATITSFAECMAAGFPIMESYPRQCSDGTKTFVEIIEQPVACTADAKICPDGTGVGRVGPDCEFAACPAVVGTLCTPAQKAAEACTMQYEPVCGYTSGDDTAPQTYGNACGACTTAAVVSYTEGACSEPLPVQS